MLGSGSISTSSVVSAQPIIPARKYFVVITHPLHAAERGSQTILLLFAGRPMSKLKREWTRVTTPPCRSLREFAGGADNGD